MKVITLIPAYNEESAIEMVVKGALKHSDVIVIDDGSTDNTYKLAKNAGATVIKHDENKGKGAAIKSGLKEGLKKGYDVFIFIDGDGQHDPEHIPLVTSHINGAKLVVGSRFMEGNPKNMPIQRRLSNKITTNLIRYVTGYNLTDSQNGFRALSKDVANLFVDIKYDDYIYESEMFYRASKNSVIIEEVPINCRYGIEKSYVTKWHVLLYFLFIFGLLFRKLRRRVNNTKNMALNTF
jgi:glycosyltransferase involved in cell wall biosynthesis